MKKNIAELFKDVVDILSQNYDSREAVNMAYILFEEIGYEKHSILANPKKIPEEQSIAQLQAFLIELSKGRPIQYVTGKAYFLDLVFEVTESVLIPRPETEELVLKAYSEIQKSAKKSLNVLDIGTGSGCIAIMLKHKFPELKLTALDISSEALSVAKKNAQKLNVEIEFLEADFLEDAFTTDVLWDMIVSNPPYVKKSEKVELAKHVLDFEPLNALFPPGEDPCIFYRKIAAFGAKKLKKEGKVIVEIHPDLHNEIKEIFEQNGFKNIEILKDISDRMRILVAAGQFF